MVFGCFQTIEFRRDPADRLALNDVPIENLCGPRGALGIDRIPHAGLRVSPSPDFAAGNRLAHVTEAVIAHRIPTANSPLLSFPHVPAEFFDVLFMLETKHRRQHIPSANRRINSL